MQESFSTNHFAVTLGKRRFYLPSDPSTLKPKELLKKCRRNFQHYRQTLQGHLGSYRDYSRPGFYPQGSMIYTAKDIYLRKVKISVWDGDNENGRSWQVYKLKKFTTEMPKKKFHYKWVPVKYQEAIHETITERALKHFKKCKFRISNLQKLPIAC